MCDDVKAVGVATLGFGTRTLDRETGGGKGAGGEGAGSVDAFREGPSFDATNADLSRNFLYSYFAKKKKNKVG